MRPTIASSFVVLLALPAPCIAQLLPSPPQEQCTAAPSRSPTAREWLDSAAARVLPRSTTGRVLRYRASHDVPLWEQSDRMYEPYVPNVSLTLRWYDPATNVEARQSVERPLAHGAYPQQ